MYSCVHLRNKIQSFHFRSYPTVPVFINHMMNASKYSENVADLRYVGITEL